MPGPRPSPDPQPAVSGRSANGFRPDPPPADDLQAMLFRVLADGRPHAMAELVSSTDNASTDGCTDPSAAVRQALAGLVALGVPIGTDGRTARSRPSVPLDATAIFAALTVPGSAFDDPKAVRVAWATDSTNSELLRRVRDRDASAAALSLLFATEVQDGGRGRLGRRWRSAPGASLTVSMALPVARRLAALDGVTLVCGLAVRDALSVCGVDAALKWPNDVLVGGRKLAGILVEAHVATPVTTVLVVGIGINVLPPARSGNGGSSIAPTDLQTCGATTLDRNVLAARIALALTSRLAAFAIAGFAPARDAWNVADAFGGRPVAIGAAGGADGTDVVGVAHGVDSTGALLVEVDGRMRRIVAGDVSLRPQIATRAGSTA